MLTFLKVNKREYHMCACAHSCAGPEPTSSNWTPIQPQDADLAWAQLGALTLVRKAMF